MSGHSHFATIKRQKAVNDAAKGKIFSKMARNILIAVKTGGSADPNANYKLRMAIDTARAAGVPKDNIERALSKGSEAADLQEVTYEGFGPSGIGVIVQAATDNRNRTAQEIKNLFEKSGGRLGGPGAVSFNFVNKGYVEVKKGIDSESEMLSLIDAGAEDVEETDESFEVYVGPEKLNDVKEKITAAGFEVLGFDLVLKPKTVESIDNADKAKKAMAFLEALDDHEDVQKVFSNLDIPDNIASAL